MDRFGRSCGNPDCGRMFLSRDDFYVDNSRKDGLARICKECDKAGSKVRSAEQHAKDPKPRREAARKVNEGHKLDYFYVYRYPWIGGWAYIGCCGWSEMKRLSGHKQESKKSSCLEILNTLGDPEDIQILGRFQKSEDGARERAEALETWCIDSESIWNRRLLNKAHNRRHDKSNKLYGRFDKFEDVDKHVS